MYFQTAGCDRFDRPGLLEGQTQNSETGLGRSWSRSQHGLDSLLRINVAEFSFRTNMFSPLLIASLGKCQTEGTRSCRST